MAKGSKRSKSKKGSKKPMDEATKRLLKNYPKSSRPFAGEQSKQFGKPMISSTAPLNVASAVTPQHLFFPQKGRVAYAGTPSPYGKNTLLKSGRIGARHKF